MPCTEEAVVYVDEHILAGKKEYYSYTLNNLR